MEQTVFVANPTRLLIAAAVGIIVLLLLIIKFKLHPVISMMIAAIIIGVGAGMPLTMISDTVEKGVGKTLQGIALLVGLGSMFGGILEVSGGAQRKAQTLIDKLGQKKAGIALGITGLVIGTTVFFEAGVVVLIPLAFSVAKQTKKSTLYYAIPLLAGLASGYAFVPPSAGSVLVADSLGVNLGVMIMVGIPTALICMIVAGVIWGRFIGNKVFTKLPVNVEEIKEDSKELPPFGLVLGVILIPLVLILVSTVSKYMPIPVDVKNVLGNMAYLLEGVKRLTNIPSYHVRLKSAEYEGEGDFIFGMVTNSRSVGGFKNIIGRHVRFDDGVFEVTFVRTPKTPLEVQEILAAIVLKEMDSKYMVSFCTANLEIFAEQLIPWTLDGEYGGNYADVVIKNHQKALLIRTGN